jgi:hypothetical protein
VQLLERLASLLLVARVDHGRRAGRDAGVAIPSLAIGVVSAAVIVKLFDLGGLGILVGKLLNSGVRHFGSS